MPNCSCKVFDRYPWCLYSLWAMHRGEKPFLAESIYGYEFFVDAIEWDDGRLVALGRYANDMTARVDALLDEWFCAA